MNDWYLDPPDEEEDCKVCGAEDVDFCICQECPVCFCCGDSKCYTNHGLRRTEEQKFALECANRWWELNSWKEQEGIKSAILESIFD